MFNKDLAKCDRRMQFMDKKFCYLQESLTQYIEEGELQEGLPIQDQENPDEMLNVVEFIAQNKMRDAVAHQNFLSKK